MEQPVLLRIKDAATILGVSRSTVTHLCNRKKITPIFTEGGQRRIPKTEIDRYSTSLQQAKTERAAKNKQQTQAAREALTAKREQMLMDATKVSIDEIMCDIETEPVDRTALADLFKRQAAWDAEHPDEAGVSENNEEDEML